jgi:hypothetical protein
MDIAGMLAQSGALENAARELGIDPQTAATGAAALLPAILGGFKNQAQAAPGGLEGLGGLLGQMGGGGLLDAVVGTQATPVDQGNNILGTIFGSKDVSRQVAGAAATQSGVSADTLKKLLPIVAMLVAGYLASQRSGDGAAAPAGDSAAAPAGGGGLGGMLGGALGGMLGSGGQQAGAGGGMGGMLGQVLGSVLGGGRRAPSGAPSAGAGGLAGMLDMDGDGNPLNDIIGMAGRLNR